MVIKNAEFITTVANDKILTYTKNEFAFVGRSNAGKSSLINALTNNKSLAKTGQKARKNLILFGLNGAKNSLFPTEIRSVCAQPLVRLLAFVLHYGV